MVAKADAIAISPMGRENGQGGRHDGLVVGLSPTSPHSPVASSQPVRPKRSTEYSGSIDISGDDDDEDDLHDASGTTALLSRTSREPANSSMQRRRQGFLGLLPPSLASFVENNVGLLFMALAQMFFTFMGLTVKYFLSTSEISTLTLIAVRMAITSFLCIVVMLLLGVPHPYLGPPELRRLLAARGLFGFGGLFSSYQALRHLSVSDSTTITFLTPTTTALLGWLYLGESLSWQEVAGGGMCLIGVLCVSRPPFIFGAHSVEAQPTAGAGVAGGDKSRLVGVSWALASVCASTLAYITIRSIGKRAHALHSMTYFASLCTVVCILALFVVPGPFVFVSSTRDFTLIIIIGIFGFIAQMLLTLGLQREKAGRATLASYLSLFYSLTLEFFLFHTVPPFLSVFGAAIIISSAVWVALSKPQAEAAAIPAAVDEESAPTSRTPSPVPAPRQRTLRSDYRVDASDGSQGRQYPPVPGSSPKIDQLGIGKKGALPSVKGAGVSLNPPRMLERRRSSGNSISSLTGQ